MDSLPVTYPVYGTSGPIALWKGSELPPPSPEVASWELVRRLRDRRVERGVEVHAITRALGFTRNYFSAVENGRKTLTSEKLTMLLDLLDFDSNERRELLRLREVAKQRGWWAEYAGLLSSELQRLIGLEHGAERTRFYESLLIPGLLQTADYARAMMIPDATIRTVDVDQLIEVRLRRQARLHGEDPLRLTAVVSEAALLQQIGGPAVLRRQLEHLAETIEAHRDTVDVRVIPFTARACGLFGAATVQLLDFESESLPTLAWQETVTTRGVIDDPNQVRDLSLTHDRTLEQTLNADKSLSLVRMRTKELA